MRTPGEALEMIADHYELWFKRRYPEETLSSFVHRERGERFFTMEVWKENGFSEEDKQVFRDMTCFTEFTRQKNKQGVHVDAVAFRFDFEVK